MVAVAILAAGRGTRMKSELPKVLHPLGGRSLVQRVLESCHLISPVRQFVIVGYRGDLVQDSLTDVPGLEFVTQSQQLGTGHAVQQVLPYLEGFTGDLLVLNGDVPLLRPETISHLLATHKSEGNGATILTAQHPHPKGYGRVFSDSDNLLQQIVEDRDCTTAQRQNRRINAGVYCFNWPQLAQVLPQLKSENDQQEYYLTDAVNYLDRVMTLDVEDYQEILGINDRKQLATAHQILQDRIKEEWMKAGVTLIDPDSITIDDTVQIGSDVVIEPQTHLRGNTVIGSGCRIGPGSLIENSEIGEQVTILYSVISESCVKSSTRIGPYAHLRGQAEIGAGCRVGNFVEIKKSQVGDRTNIAHLSYIGDAQLGQQVNVGAGTITANYDGYQKHKTVIGDRTKTGSNSVLVAPITIGEDVTIGAGSVVTKDVQNDALVVARAPQKVRPGWRPKGVSKDEEMGG
ncbi:MULTISPECIES: bifunctional UDP-N-acetylglucosamine diphosphorylase/glucosamine-1-phosphate N-acetyltransferase GlmU [unclassified Roseofilum]|uniref:bifunctional UDP-N-acetylglucosamine diphosphorylase/glucosamine-1-phosphate N-acetyltransferase GlmU n=1 Tax=unclassified Roseofilum TaxID=2620099 RepID=UPI000E86D9B5|nr:MULTISPECIES: bifunctional UDP-N-acetylglucosamine diphosphorylase/glucosamine-1-phosphate N-acetyltransferase GlmU [unclassified Roseofilum]HBQ98238.1 bifunctional UDP-N-acetylglucosamine diphosphorylase/glucosamine-1-phosphate N-acetyltransferase GlmU [Cyanobacteria bacterium UBA11691]MBP0009557.1 bifunctional UDP-N-acetylglucosamine diphosphorylase/glucosamine-1-phosphate N-acetyltransferase GlmU [Roseofilum sp. Belize Diploria]MBP0013726.1 bifunctional UDP-N-acetylglucosamine diphosphoryl